MQRDLAEQGYHRDVVAPTSIPSPRSKQIKTDRIDATQLVQFYANSMLTCISMPEPELEQDRDLIRSRQQLLHQQTDLRKHMQALLRQLQGLDGILTEYEQQIEALAKTPLYQKQCALGSGLEFDMSNAKPDTKRAG